MSDLFATQPFVDITRMECIQSNVQLATIYFCTTDLNKGNHTNATCNNKENAKTAIMNSFPNPFLHNLRQ